tara:strand:+ start:10366 stop:10650 length:285 start_codon:yes stop_codon:yes gene_type:complete
MEDWISVGDNDTEYQNEMNSDQKNILNMVDGYNNEIEELDSTIIGNENNVGDYYMNERKCNETSRVNFDVYSHVKKVLYHLKELFFDLKRTFCL